MTLNTKVEVFIALLYTAQILSLNGVCHGSTI